MLMIEEPLMSEYNLLLDSSLYTATKSSHATMMSLMLICCRMAKFSVHSYLRNLTQQFAI